jgi:hypothetical protein
MNIISKEVQLIAGAIKQAFEMEPNPGNSVNQTDNPHQVALIGRYNLYKAAEGVWERIKAHLAAEQARIEKELKAQIAKIETGRDSAVSPAIVETPATTAPAPSPATVSAPADASPLK